MNQHYPAGSPPPVSASWARVRTESDPVAQLGLLRAKIERVTIVRAVMVTLLLGSAVVLNLDDLAFFSEPSYVAVVALIITSYVATVFYALWIRIAVDPTMLAMTQIAGDAILAGGLVLATGGSESAFSFLFILGILTAAHLMGRTGALFSATLSSLALSLLAVLQGSGLPNLEALAMEIGIPIGEVSQVALTFNVVAFFSVGILGGHLAEKLGQVDIELALSRTDVLELTALTQNIVSSVSGGLCVLDNRENVILFNRAAERITGHSSMRLTGQHRPDVLQPLMAVLDTFRSQPVLTQPTEIILHSPDDVVRFVDVFVSALFDAKGQSSGHILFFTDVTHMRRMQDFLERQKRMAAIGQLSAAIAHEIRNPLASISGSIEMLQMRLPPQGDDTTDSLMNIVVREVERLNRLIEDFLLYARPRKFRSDLLDLGETLRETVTLARQDPALVDLVLDLELEERMDCRVEGDTEALRQVFWNLIQNAAQAIARGAKEDDEPGKIKVTLETRQQSDRPLAVEVTVIDSGPGLSAEARQRLFEPFFTTRETGTGLGLATVHRIINAHDGAIWAENRPTERGAIFHVLLPRRRPSTQEFVRRQDLGSGGDFTPVGGIIEALAQPKDADPFETSSKE